MNCFNEESMSTIELNDLGAAPSKCCSFDEWKHAFAEAIDTLSLDNLNRYFNIDDFSSIWKDILTSTDLQQSLSDALNLLSNYRRLANVFRNSVSLKLTLHQYNLLQIQSFLHAIYDSECKTSIKQNDDLLSCNLNSLSISTFVSSLSREMHSLLLDEICVGKLPIILQYVGSVWALKSLQILQKKSNKSKLSMTTEDENIKAYKLMIQLYVTKALESIEAIDVIDELGLVNAGSELFAISLVESFQAEHYFVFLHRVSCLWGSNFFISQGKELMQIYLTALITHLLDRVDALTLLQSGSHHSPIAIVLSSGVSAYFDTTDRKSRERAMNVAKLFSAKLGNEINFSKSNDDGKDDGNGKDHAVSSHDSGRIDALDTKDSHNGNSTRSSHNADGDDDSSVSDSDSDSSDFSDLEPLLQQHDESAVRGGRGQPQHANKAVYLRTCLEMIMWPESKPEASVKHMDGLTSLPAIVANCPADGPDVCGALMKELLRLQNSFNLQDFSELVSSAVNCLLTAFPWHTAPLVTAALFADTVSIGSKLECMKYLSTAAYSLAGISSTAEMNTQSTSSSSSTSLIAAAAAAAAIINEESSLHSKTRIKRPTKLSQHGTTKRVFRNAFGPVAHLFFFPVANFLLLHLKKASQQSGPVAVASSLIHGEGSVEAIGSGSSGGSVGSVGNDKRPVMDEIDAMVLAQSLLTLAAFCRSSLNTPIQKKLATESFRYSFYCKEFYSLSVRRAALSCMLSSVEAFLLLWRSSQAATDCGDGSGLSSSSALQSLCDITGGMDDISFMSSSSSSQVDVEVLTVLASAVQWIECTYALDSDRTVQILKKEIMRNILIIYDSQLH